MANILIVEDNVMNMEMAGELLENAGHFIIKTENASDGIKLAKIKKPDLILMDLNLSGMDGLTATKILKEDFSTKNIPIIAFTAKVMQNDKEKAYGAGCCGFISKPIEISAFVNNVESFLNSENNTSLQSIINSNFEGFSRNSKENQVAKIFNQPETTVAKKQKTYKKHKVLIIDDNPMNTEILKEILDQINQSSVVVHNGKHALDIVEKEKFDLILLDVMMPEMSGFDVIKQLKSKTSTKDIPVIFVSALDKTSAIVKGFNLGSYEYIIKPFNIEEVKARILSILKIKDLQDELKAEKEVLELVFKFSADGIVILDSDFKIISCNELFSKWLNLSKEKIINQDFCCIFGNNNDFCRIKQCLQASEGCTNFCLEINADSDKEKRFLEISCSKINQSLNEVEGYVLILRDFTEHKEIEQQKETFVATLTHDLKTPVRAQMRALEMLLDEKFGKINDNQKEIIEETVNSNKYMFGMVENLLATYRYENKSVNIQKHYFDINDLIKNCYEQIKYLAEDKKQAINFNFERKTLNLYADSLEIKRVIINLLSNAINYTCEYGQIIISSKLKDDAVIISFADNGKGLSAQEISTIFNKYQSFAKKFRQVGTGLGLYLSKHIIESHNGTISVISDESTGSVFTIKLPVK
ncbi:MAG: response regulator [bacterium]